MFSFNTRVTQVSVRNTPQFINISLAKAIQRVKNSDVGIRLGMKLNAFKVLTVENNEDLKHLPEILVDK